jgi:hypothetical protein
VTTIVTVVYRAARRYPHRSAPAFTRFRSVIRIV